MSLSVNQTANPGQEHVSNVTDLAPLVSDIKTESVDVSVRGFKVLRLGARANSNLLQSTCISPNPRLLQVAPSQSALDTLSNGVWEPGPPF